MMRPERQKQFLKSDLNSLHLHANVRFIVTVNDLLNAFYLINAPFIRRPPLINVPCLIDAPYGDYINWGHFDFLAPGKTPYYRHLLMSAVSSQGRPTVEELNHTISTPGFPSQRNHDLNISF